MQVLWLCWLSWLALAPISQGPAAAEKAAIGELVPDYDFRELSGGDGRRKLSELRGQPVFIVNWTDTDFGRGAAGQAEKVSKELVSQGLVCILLDTHNKAQEDIEASVMRLYPGNVCWLSRNQKLPIQYLDNGPPPDVALIGVDGKLLIAGSYTSDFGKARELAEAELERLKTGWGNHKVAQKARAEAFGRKHLAAARALIEEGLKSEPEQPELLAVQAEVETSRRCWMDSVGILTERGEFLRALDVARALSEAVVGNTAWEGEAAGLLTSFETPEAEAELARDRKLAALLKTLQRKKPAQGDIDKLSSFAKSCGDTRVGRRASHIAQIAARTR